MFYDGKIYAADDHNLYSIDTTSGKIIWNVAHGLVNYWPPDVSGGAVYLTGESGPNTSDIVAFNASNGQMLWRGANITGYTTVRPNVSGSLVYVAIGCTLSALDSRTGSTIWHWTLSGCSFWFAYYGPIISGYYLVLSDDISYLVAFRGESVA